MVSDASSIVILIGGVDRTASVIYSTASFESLMNAVPGSCSLTIRDPDRTLSFTTGDEISLTIDGVKLFGGYVTQVSMVHLAPAADTANLSTYNLRAWNLRGTDYNIIFDRRVIRNTADYLHFLPQVTASATQDGDLLKSLLTNYTDTADFTTTNIANTRYLPGDKKGKLAYKQQGTKLRDQFQQWSLFSGTVWYIDANKDFHWQTYDNVDKRWGFSDQPNYNAITASPASYQSATVGFREVEATEDGSYIENDVLIWGGSQFAGAGGTVVSRAQDATSESTHGRWQYAATHFGESLYETQASVDAQSDAFLNGPPGADALGQTKGLKFPQYQYTFTWFADRVPKLSGVPNHLVAGDLVTITLAVFGISKQLPLRSLRISFPTVPEDTTVGVPKTYVQFTGTFGLQLSDPFTLWRYLLTNQPTLASAPLSSVVTVNNTSTQTTYGAYYTGVPSPATGNGSTTAFTIPFGYIDGTLAVYVDGALKIPTTDYTETTPETGSFTMIGAPASGAKLLVTARTLSS